MAFTGDVGIYFFSAPQLVYQYFVAVLILDLLVLAVGLLSFIVFERRDAILWMLSLVFINGAIAVVLAGELSYAGDSYFAVYMFQLMQLVITQSIMTIVMWPEMFKTVSN